MLARGLCLRQPLKDQLGKAPSSLVQGMTRDGWLHQLKSLCKGHPGGPFTAYSIPTPPCLQVRTCPVGSAPLWERVGP